MPAGLYDSLITQLSLQIDKKTTLSKKFVVWKRPKKFLQKFLKIMLTSKYARGIITEHLEKVGPVAQVVRAHP